MKTDATLTVNGTDYPIEIDPHLTPAEGRARGGRA